MHKLFRKITSTLTAFVLVGSNFIPAVVYATNEIMDSKTDEEILFDAKINDNSSYVASLDDELSLNINLSIEGNGYIKGGTIKIDNNNYKLGEIEENNDLKKVDNNTFELNQINGSKSVNMSIPIEFEKTELMDIDYFDKESF